MRRGVCLVVSRRRVVLTLTLLPSRPHRCPSDPPSPLPRFRRGMSVSRSCARERHAVRRGSSSARFVICDKFRRCETLRRKTGRFRTWTRQPARAQRGGERERGREGGRSARWRCIKYHNAAGTSIGIRCNQFGGGPKAAACKSSLRGIGSAGTTPMEIKRRAAAWSMVRYPRARARIQAFRASLISSGRAAGGNSKKSSPEARNHCAQRCDNELRGRRVFFFFFPVFSVLFFPEALEKCKPFSFFPPLSQFFSWWEHVRPEMCAARVIPSGQLNILCRLFHVSVEQRVEMYARYSSRANTCLFASIARARARDCRSRSREPSAWTVPTWLARALSVRFSDSIHTVQMLHRSNVLLLQSPSLPFPFHRGTRKRGRSSRNFAA